jgi:hypothetical protein
MLRDRIFEDYCKNINKNSDIEDSLSELSGVTTDGFGLAATIYYFFFQATNNWY